MIATGANQRKCILEGLGDSISLLCKGLCVLMVRTKCHSILFLLIAQHLCMLWLQSSILPVLQKIGPIHCALTLVYIYIYISNTDVYTYYIYIYTCITCDIYLYIYIYIYISLVATQRAAQCIPTESLVKPGGWNKATMQKSNESQPWSTTLDYDQLSETIPWADITTQMCPSLRFWDGQSAVSSVYLGPESI